MKAKLFLLIFMFTMNILNVTAQAKKPVRTVSNPQKAITQQPVKDKKIEFKMKFVEGGKFVIDSINNYYVVPFTGKTAHQLYMEQLARIASIYSSPERVTEKVEDKTIVLNAAESKLMTSNGIAGKEEVIVRYRIELQFKDGKIRVNPPTITKAIRYIPNISKFEDIDMNTLSVTNMFLPGFSRNMERYFNFLFEMLVYGNGKQDEDW